MNLTIKFLPIILFVTLCNFSSAQGGSPLRLSDLSSDETPAADLRATLDFSVVGSTLVLTLTNETSGNSSFDVSAIYFNSLATAGLTLDAGSTADGWVIALNERADGFGVFDFGLLSELGNDPGEIGPGQSRQFEFELSGTGPFADSDFTTQFSTSSNRPSLAAIKFINGPGDDSAFGATNVPEPATLLLLFSGIAVMAARKR